MSRSGFFCDAWRKHLERSIVEGAEATAIDIILRHPEYQALLASGDDAIARDWTPEGGEMNPSCTSRCTSRSPNRSRSTSHRAFAPPGSSSPHATIHTLPSTSSWNVSAKPSSVPSRSAVAWMPRPTWKALNAPRAAGVEAPSYNNNAERTRSRATTICSPQSASVR